MRRFVLRTFVSVWVIMILTLVLTLFGANWLPAGPADQADARILAAVANEVEDYLALRSAAGVALEAAAGVDAILDRHESNAGGGLGIFLIDAGGADTRGRDLPLPVARWLRASHPALMDDMNWATGDPRLVVHGEVGGYRLVGYRSDYRPLLRALNQPGGRLMLLGSALLVSLAVSFVLARFIVRPVRRLRDASQRVVDGDSGVRLAAVAGGGGDAIAQLARNFDAVAERLP